MKLPLVVANWKMNPASLKEARELFECVGEMGEVNCEVVVCPPFPFIPFGEKVTLGAQNCFCKDLPTFEGSFTGEVSPSMLRDLGCEYVIVGHSERRTVLGERDENINAKVGAAVFADLTPILCVGEEDEKEGGEKVKKQIEEGLKGVSSLEKVVVAYEPLFAIGTGKPCSIDLATERKDLIKEALSGIAPESEGVPVLYGGSVDENNCREYIEEAGFNGLLVGGASLKKEKFRKIVKKL